MLATLGSGGCTKYKGAISRSELRRCCRLYDPDYLILGVKYLYFSVYLKHYFLDDFLQSVDEFAM